jgi:hypothetical protein
MMPHVFTQDEKTLMKKWVDNWKTTGPLLEQIRRKELREFVHEDHLAAMRSLLELGAKFAKPRTTTGMVEMQRLFMKARP